MALELLSIFKSRKELLSELSGKRSCEIVVVGGGIHGASFARLAALNGLDTVLLERNDYGSATSSRSSKMVHGGLRYLESLDFRQVYEGIKAREELFSTAAHLVKPQQFLIPVLEGMGWNKFKIAFGLTLYDLMHGKKERRHSWTRVDGWLQKIMEPRKQKVIGCHRYIDGVMNDYRLVLENIISARQEGALCLNYLSAEHIGMNPSGRVEVFWKDSISAQSGSVEAGIVVSCAGPWAPYIGKHRSAFMAEKVCYSQGAHLIFSESWKHEALLLPMEERGRYYFVWPHPAGTLVGTTERSVDQIEIDPQPKRDEVEEILSRLKADLPGSGLDRSSLHYAFAGTRTMAVWGRKNQNKPSRISRRHLWHFERGVLTLIGGKFTTAQWTAEEGMKRVLELSKLSGGMVTVRKRELPGCGNLESAVREFKEEGRRRMIEEQILDRCIARLGSWVRYIGKSELTESGEESWNLIGGKILHGELELALHIEQAETLEDLMRRRLELEYLPGHGLEIVKEIGVILGQYRPGVDLLSEEQRYRARLDNLHKIMGKL